MIQVAVRGICRVVIAMISVTVGKYRLTSESIRPYSASGRKSRATEDCPRKWVKERPLRGPACYAPGRTCRGAQNG